MSVRKTLMAVVACAVMVSGCDYIVTPAEDESQGPVSTKGWGGVATSVAQTSSGGTLRVELTIRNDTGHWSAMDATPGSAAVSGGGRTASCDTMFVGTGGNRVAPGFQIRGYTGGSKAKPVTQLLYVECKGAIAAADSRLSLSYTYVIGDFNYFEASKQYKASLSVDLTEVAADLVYPVATSVDGLIEQPGAKIAAINHCTLQLTDAKRTATGMDLSWQDENPTDYPVILHIGTPPVIGSDGVIYGPYESPTLTEPDLTGPKQSQQWTTRVVVPSSVSGLYIMVSVESRQAKLFVSHVIDITSK